MHTNLKITLAEFAVTWQISNLFALFGATVWHCTYSHRYIGNQALVTAPVCQNFSGNLVSDTTYSTKLWKKKKRVTQ
jgi:hypothetical protein